MSPIATLLRLTFAAAVALACLLAPAAVGPDATALAQEIISTQGVPQWESVAFELPEGEQDRVWKFSMRYPDDFHEYGNGTFTPNSLHGEIRGPGPLELIIGIDGPPNRCPLNAMRVQVADGPNDVWGGKEIRVGSRYRRLFLTDVESRRLFVAFQFETGQEWLSYDDAPDGENAPENIDCEVTVALTRRFDRCTMYAQVSGDANGTYFGDSAYFMTVAPGTPIELAPVVDPGMAELMESLMAMAEGAAKLQGEVADTTPELVCDDNGENCVEKEQPTSFAEAMRQWAAEDDPDAEPRATDGDTLALALADVKFSNRGVDEYYMNPKWGDRPDNAVLADAAAGLGGFAIYATAPSLLLPYDDGPPTELPPMVPLSTLTVLPGIMDDAFSGIKFVWEKGGAEGQAYLFLAGLEDNRIAGVVTGRLRSERRYRQGYLYIEVNASFVALRGPRACQGQY